MQYILTLTLLIIASCVPTSYNVENITSFPSNKKAIIILKISSDYYNISWCKFQESSDEHPQYCFKTAPSNGYKILMIEPARYEISGFQKISTRMKVSEQKFMPNFSNLTKHRRSKPFIIFDAEEGEISYLGNITYHDTNFVGTLIRDEFNQVKNAIETSDLSIFKGYQTEVNFIKTLPNLLKRNLAKTKIDLAEETQIKKAKEKEKERLFKKKLREIKKTEKKTKIKVKTKLNLKKYEN